VLRVCPFRQNEEGARSLKHSIIFFRRDMYESAVEPLPDRLKNMLHRVFANNRFFPRFILPGQIASDPLLQEKSHF